MARPPAPEPVAHAVLIAGVLYGFNLALSPADAAQLEDDAPRLDALLAVAIPDDAQVFEIRLLLLRMLPLVVDAPGSVLVALPDVVKVEILAAWSRFAQCVWLEASLAGSDVH